jgi:hypothetical protein
MSNIDPCRNALRALRRSFDERQARRSPSKRQPFTPVCVSIKTPQDPHLFRMFCLSRTGRRLPGLAEEYTVTITGSQLPEVVRRKGRWVRTE